MLKRYSFFIILLIAIVALSTSAFAVENARNAQYVLTTAAIADAGTGDCVDIDTSGHLQVDIAASSATVTTSSTLGAGTAEIGKVKISDGTEQASVDTESNLEVAEDSKLSKVCTEAELVLTGSGRFYGLQAIGASAGDTATVYDNTAGSGTVIAFAKLGTDVSQSGYFIPGGVNVSTGIYVTGTDADVDTIVYYKDY